MIFLLLLLSPFSSATESRRSSNSRPLRFLRHSSLYGTNEYPQPPSSAPIVISREGESNGEPSLIVPSSSTTQIVTPTQVQPTSLIYETPSISSSVWNPSGGYPIAPRIQNNIAPIPIGYGQLNGGYYNQQFPQPFIQNPYYRSSPMYPQQFYPQQSQQFYPQPLQQGYYPSYGGYPQGCYPRYNSYRNGC